MDSNENEKDIKTYIPWFNIPYSEKNRNEMGNKERKSIPAWRIWQEKAVVFSQIGNLHR